MDPQLHPLDAVLRQAIAHQQAGQLIEAERLYHQILAFRPDFAEVHVSCAMIKLRQGNPTQAEASLRRAIGAKPDLAKAHYHLGDTLSFQQRFDEAIPSYRRAIELNPQYAEAYNNMGNALLIKGDLEQAAEAYHRAISLRPGFAQAHNNLGHVHLSRGRCEEARAAFTQATTIAPNYADAHNNLGIALRHLKSNDAAANAFRSAIRLQPRSAEAHFNLSATLFDMGKLPEAEAIAREAIQLNPRAPEAHNALANALREQGDLLNAQACYRKAIELDSGYIEGYKHLGMLLAELGELDEAFTFLNRHAQTAFGGSSRNYELASGVSSHKKLHDAEQRAWLGEVENSFHIYEASRLTGPAVNPANQIGKISEEWNSNRPQVVVIDDLLTAEALDKLRHFCLASTIWRKDYPGGYLGALPEYGFSCPLLAQIAEELRSFYPAIIRDHPLLHWWAFKYDSSLRGIEKHADFAAVNVNFWITPDDANLDSSRGGLVIWDVAAPLDWDFVKYNAAADEISAFLMRRNAKSMRVPYRANRAVIFDSDLFHETDTISFKPGYENRRINITLLYGRRQGEGQQAQK